MPQICCKCGKSEEVEKVVNGFCLSCFTDEFPLVLSLPDKTFNLTTCKLCGDLMYHNNWREVHDTPKEIIHDFLDEFIGKMKTVKGTEAILVSDFYSPPHDAPSKQELLILFEGTPHEEVPPYQQEVTIEMIVNIGVCERCAKYTRGYFESIVQIRSPLERDIQKNEQLTISKLIQSVKQDNLEAGNRMAYISKTVDQKRGGIDLYIGDEKFAKQLATKLADLLAAGLEYSTKLKSMKDGKPVYQSTYCVRLPLFEIGDIVSYQNRNYQVIAINLGRALLFDLETHEQKTLSKKESGPEKITIQKKKDQFQKFIILNIQEPNVSLMNTASYKTIDIDTDALFADHQEGDEIVMVELDEGLFECHNM
jgi:nonsense-mediated mRNA decay protein 3